MKRIVPLVAALAALVLTGIDPATAAEDDPARWVDPFIGTGAHGHTHPAATLPFGMVQLGPDTRLEGWDGCSGYHFDDRVIYGFSHTHLSGTGIPDYADILFMPQTDEPRWNNGYKGEAVAPGPGYASRFDKGTERAGPGWYAVTLSDAGVAVELTATPRTGWHRYRYPEARPAHLIVDLTHRDEVIDSALRVTSDSEIEGYRRSTGWARDQVVYFVARVSRPFSGITLSSGDAPLPGRRAAEGKKVKGILSFGDAGGEVIIKVGLSAVDIDGAHRNLEAEAPGWDFDATRQAARRVWNEALHRVDVEGGTEDQRVIFHTALYHSLLAPNLFSDVDGRYHGMDHAIHRAARRDQFTVFSLWDTFRAAHPLYTLIEPRRSGEFVRTFLAQYREGGRLPVWELAGNETDTMIGYHAVSVIADAWVKGIRGYDGREALAAMVDSASRDHFGLEPYKRQGFIGADDAAESVSRTLEYAYDDWCIARMAEALGRDEVAKEFSKRSQGWRHLLDPVTGYMRPRRAQRWLAPFDPRRVDNNYTEANAWQYSFFVPHDMEGLMAKLGGDGAFASRLDIMFDSRAGTTGRDQADITGLIGQYAHGNEPSHHVAWLYHYAGRPERSAERVRTILDTLYTSAPGGLSGNEDCGQMSSWYVLAAIGLYQPCPCSDEYLLVPPLFPRVTLTPDGGRPFIIRADGAGPEGKYITAARLNGRPLTRSFLRHSEMASGGELVLTLGSAPGTSWGMAPEDRPRSRVTGDEVVPAPFVRSGLERFRGEVQVELACADPNASIRYSFDPKAPEAAWRSYTGPFPLTESARLRVVAERDGRRSPVVEAPFHRIPNDWKLVIAGRPNDQYTAGGPDALIDGLRGGADWRTGGWQGYQGQDFEATVDLGRATTIRRAGAGFLQDVRSWIWMPKEVVIQVSTDGVAFREAARLTSGVADDAPGIIVRDVTADLGGLPARFVRVTARSYGEIPSWHPGRGGEAFIFVDELLIE
jgi:predicted alpha-1,2-mannosidase